MARGGQNVKPLKDHEAKGNYRPVRHENRIQEISKVVESIPKAPKYFDKRHADKWAEVCKNLYDLTILKTVDLDLVEKYVVNWFVSHDAWMEIQKEGITQDGRPANPALWNEDLYFNESQKFIGTNGVTEWIPATYLMAQGRLGRDGLLGRTGYLAGVRYEQLRTESWGWVRTRVGSTAAQQTADGGAVNTNNLRVQIYQVSATVGRGFKNEFVA